MQQLAQPAAEGFIAGTSGGTELYGGVYILPTQLLHLYCCRPVEFVHVQQPRDPRLHWMPIAADGTSRHEASYVNRTLGGTSSPDQFSSRRLLGGSEEWATLYAAAEKVDFDQQLRDASKVIFQDTAGADRETLFFLCAGGKAQILMAIVRIENLRLLKPWCVGFVGAIGQSVLPALVWKTPLMASGKLCSQLEPYIDTLQPTIAFRTMGYTGCCVSLFVVFPA